MNHNDIGGFEIELKNKRYLVEVNAPSFTRKEKDGVRRKFRLGIDITWAAKQEEEHAVISSYVEGGETYVDIDNNHINLAKLLALKNCKKCAEADGRQNGE